MPDKLTDNEKTKALECCIEGDCDNCPYDEQTACNEYMKQDCLDLINRQKAENKELQDLIVKYNGDFAKQEAEIERLKNAYKQCVFERDAYIEIENTAIAEAKAEAYKEFEEKAVERVEKARQKYQRLCKEQGEEMEEHMHIHFNGIIGIIKNLLKELVGEE